jgi:hypothetical protein
LQWLQPFSRFVRNGCTEPAMLHLLGDIAVATGVGVLMVVFIAWTFRGIEAAIDRARARRVP